MQKPVRDSQVTLRLSRKLRDALERQAADAGGCGLSAIIRQILTDVTARRITEQGSAREHSAGFQNHEGLIRWAQKKPFLSHRRATAAAVRNTGRPSLNRWMT